MRIVHAAWIPDETAEFIRRGHMYLWVESDAPARPRPRQPGAPHPRALAGADLAAFLAEQLKLAEDFPGQLRRLLVERWFLLPSADGLPLPSPELLPYLEEAPPEQYAPQSWKLACHRVDAPIARLSDIHFAALQGADDYQLGSDFLCWQQFLQALKGFIVRDQFIPAIREQAAAEPDGRRGANAHGPLYYGWEWRAEEYDDLIARYAAALPAAGAAGAATTGRQRVFAAKSLLRHAAECLLHNVVTGTPLPAAFDRSIADSLVERAFHERRSAQPPPEPEWTDYLHWAAWRDRLAARQTTAAFRLGFRLVEAAAAAPDAWRMELLVAARDDPSLQLRLADYWPLPPTARAATGRRFGDQFAQHLLLALGYAARIYPKLWEGLRGDQPTGFDLTLAEAFAFLKEDAWVLRDAGFAVLVPAWWTPEGRRRAKVRLKASLRKAPPTGTAAPRSYLSAESLVAYDYQLAIGGEPVSEAEWRQLVAAKTPLVHFRGQWLELDQTRMQQMLTFWQQRHEEQPDLTVLDLLQVDAEHEEVEWEQDEALQEVLDHLHDKSALEPVADPPNLHGSLRAYQRRGVAWLQYLERLGLNPCLADDMGLGKTVQVIAQLAGEKAAGVDGPATLLIAPTSVLGNWRKEVERFAPDLRAIVHQGAGRASDERAFAAAAGACDLVITSFALARLDEKLLRGVRWRRVIVDEAQNIKNPKAAQTRAIQKLAAPHRLALTGTPVENRLRDLWSIFQFLNPGYLGKEAQFRRAFELPIQKDNDAAKAALLKKLVEPFILRRLKTDKQIIDDLPEKVEQTLYCNLTPEQASLYEAVVKDVNEQLEDAEGMGRRGLILATLLRLKQICNHPAQFLQDGSAFDPARSHKLERLTEMATEAIDGGESLLVFSQFTEIGAALERHLRRTLRCPVFYLHGGTSAGKRDQMVMEFQDPETAPAVFVLSLRAGGTGLTLTKASRVFHFDRWWNPAVEDQATDRAFRIGQRRAVFVHKFVALGTVEERIDAMIEAKKQVASAIVGSDEAWLTELDNATFKDLIALRRSAVLEG